MTTQAATAAARKPPNRDRTGVLSVSTRIILIFGGNLEKTSESIATEPGVVQLRSERCATDGSRVYELEVTCCDNTNPESPVCDTEPEVLQVTVPHDRRHTLQVQQDVNE
jgi:hypothetical protein